LISKKTPIRLVYFLAINAEPMRQGHRIPAESGRSSVLSPPSHSRKALCSSLKFICIFGRVMASYSSYLLLIGARFDSVVDKGLVCSTFNEGHARGVPAALSSPVFLAFLEIGSKTSVGINGCRYN